MTGPDLPFPTSGSETVTSGLPARTSGRTAELVEVVVHGPWSYELGAGVSAGISRELAARPAALIVDLLGLLDPDGASLALWLATRRACTVVRPPTRLALCLPDTTILDRRLRHINADRLPRFTTMRAARAAMTNRRPRIAEAPGTGHDVGCGH